jgi:hypothetical protein
MISLNLDLGNLFIYATIVQFDPSGELDPSDPDDGGLLYFMGVI